MRNTQFLNILARTKLAQLCFSLLLLVVYAPLSMADELDLEPYPYSSVSSSERIENSDYLVLVSVPKRINNQIRIENELRVDTVGKRETYRINDGHTSEQAFVHYQAELEKLGAKVLYQCSSRDCGRSSHWAEDIFRNTKLYGKDGSQFYMSAALNVNGEEWLATVYSVERGNRRVYTQVELLRLKTQNKEPLSTVAASEKQKIFIFNFGAGETLKISSKNKDIEEIVALYNASPSTTIYVVGHLSESYSSVDTAITQSLEASDKLAALLIDQGVDKKSVLTLGVGPLVPVNQSPRIGNRVEVLLMGK